MEMHARRGGLVGPIILIGAGIMFLLNNMGVLGWNVWFELLRLWPVLLIAIGLDILIGRRSAVGSLVIAVLLLGVLGTAIWLAVPGSPVLATGQGLTTQQINQPLEGATRAVVDIAPGIGELRISAGQESAGLVEGQVSLAQNEQLTRNFNKIGNTANFTLRTEGTADTWPFGFAQTQWQNKTWTLQLGRDVPIDLRLETGIGKADVDLSGLNITSLNVNTGVGQTVLTLPRQGRLNASIEGGVGEARITVPAGMAARIHTNGGLGKTNVKGNYVHQGEEYVSPNYDSAENQVDLTINGGVGNVTIQEQAGG
jgi:hypothetical protein